MQRRGFLSAILGAAAAPAIVSASSLMKITPVAPDTLIYKASGRYDINFDQWVRDADDVLYTPPTKLIIPAYLSNMALSMRGTKHLMVTEINSMRSWT